MGLYFVGSLSPVRRLASMVCGTARLLEAARARADLVVIDTSSYISGMVAPTLKSHKLELARPDQVVGLQRKDELAPLLRTAGRVSTAKVSVLPAHPAAQRTSTAQRAERRRVQLARHFLGPGGEGSAEHLPRSPAREAAFLPPASSPPERPRRGRAR